MPQRQNQSTRQPSPDDATTLNPLQSSDEALPPWREKNYLAAFEENDPEAYGAEEQQQVKSKRWPPFWMTKRVVVAVLVALVVCALALFLGLYLGLRRDVDSTPGQPEANVAFPIGPDGTPDDLSLTGSYTTAYDQSVLFEWTLNSFDFGPQGRDQVDILINDTVLQPIDGFGLAITDSSSYLMRLLGASNKTLYDQMLNVLFNNRTGSTAVRVPIGSSDFSLDPYTYDDATGDTNLASFSIDRDQQNIIPVLRDALNVNPNIKFLFSPWSPPAWMKTSASLNGGNLTAGMDGVLAQYYAKALAAYAAQGITPWAITPQNEPLNDAPYPSMYMSSYDQAQLASNLRTQLAAANLSLVKILGHDDNANNWGNAVAMLNINASAFDGAAFHCYNGSADQVAMYLNETKRYNKELHFTECTGVKNGKQNWWNNVQWWMDNVMLPMINMGSRTVFAWNAALNSGSGPHLLNAICEDCRGALSLTGPGYILNPEIEFNEEFYLVSHYAAATTSMTTPFPNGGQPATLLGATLPSGQANACLDAQAFGAETGMKGQTRMGLVAMNRCNSPLRATIRHRNSDATYSFPTGLTTLVWMTLDQTVSLGNGTASANNMSALREG